VVVSGQDDRTERKVFADPAKSFSVLHGAVSRQPSPKFDETKLRQSLELVTQ
jgi:hypothetical protein